MFCEFTGMWKLFYFGKSKHKYKHCWKKCIQMEGKFTNKRREKNLKWWKKIYINIKEKNKTIVMIMRGIKNGIFMWIYAIYGAVHLMHMRDNRELSMLYIYRLFNLFNWIFTFVNHTQCVQLQAAPTPASHCEFIHTQSELNAFHMYVLVIFVF